MTRDGFEPPNHSALMNTVLYPVMLLVSEKAEELLPLPTSERDDSDLSRVPVPSEVPSLSVPTDGQSGTIASA